MKKRVLAIALSTIMAASLAACGGSKPAETTAAPAAAAPAAAETTAAAAAAETTAAAADGAVDTSNAKYTINIGHINAENDSWHLAALDFKEQVEILFQDSFVYLRFSVFSYKL